MKSSKQLNPFLLQQVLAAQEIFTYSAIALYFYETGSFIFSNNLFRLFNVEKKQQTTTLHQLSDQVAGKDRQDFENCIDRITKNKNCAPFTFELLDRTLLRINHVIISDGEEGQVAIISVVKNSLEGLNEPTAKGSENENLYRMNKDLQKLNRDLALFNQLMSENFKAPLRQIYTSVEYLLSTEAGKLSNINKGNLRKVQSTVQRMVLLTTDMLAYGAVNTINKEFSTVSISEAIAKVTPGFADLIEEKNATITVTGHPHVYAINAFIHVLFEQLLNNALKYSSRTEAPVITISAEIKKTEPEHPWSPEYYNCITISDNGSGIQADEADKIFDLFYRGSNSERTKGSGVGLAICKKIMEAHGGSITVESTPGKGSSFVCCFPEG